MSEMFLSSKTRLEIAIEEANRFERNLITPEPSEKEDPDFFTSDPET
jgi:hypothetical protein